MKMKSCIDKKESFESALEKLETVVHTLENGEIDLADLLEKYTQGVLLSQFCLDKLNSAEQAMDRILQENSGKIKETKLEINE